MGMNDAIEGECTAKTADKGQPTHSLHHTYSIVRIVLPKVHKK